MKTYYQGFIVPLLLLIIAALLVGGGAYVYTQNKLPEQPAIATSTPKTIATKTPIQVTDTAASDISVPGMSKYTSSNLGFSFWYPSAWKVSETSHGIDLFDSNGNDTYLGIEKVTPPQRRLFVSRNACGPASGCADTTYYYEPSLDAWMVQKGPSELNPQGSAATYADVSKNTMGGLHMLFGNVRFGISTIIPISAADFLVVGASPAGLGGGESGIQDYLASTIVATNPKVATPVSAARQVESIQAEAKAYGVQNTVSTTYDRYVGSSFSLSNPTSFSKVPFTGSVIQDMGNVSNSFTGLVQFSGPANLFPGTSYAGAEYDIKVGDSSVSQQDCASATGKTNTTVTYAYTPPLIKGNGGPWYKGVQGSAAAGTQYTDDTYRTYTKGACYEVHFQWKTAFGGVENVTPLSTAIEEAFEIPIVNSFTVTGT